MPRTAIVADPDAGRLASVGIALSKAGYSVASASDQQALAKLLSDRPDASIVILEHSFAGAATSAPILLLIDLTNDIEDSSATWPGVADFIVKPPHPEELVFRADAIIGRATARSEARQHAERLRERLRDVSAAIRATNDPQLIAELVVNGFGKTFDADRVWFTTFDDGRVPRITAQWHRRDLRPLPDDLDGYEAAAHRMADRLWAEADVLIIDEHRNHDWDPADLEMRDWMDGMNPRTSAVIPVGEGNSSLGIIWIAQLDRPRFWSRTEISLIQHVAGNVAYGLIQGHLISGQQQVLKQLQHLDQAKTDFLATVNHELRTPLTSITAYLDMIRDGSGGRLPEDVNRMLDIIVRNSERLRRLVEDMLSVSRRDYEGTGLHLAPTRVGHTLRIITAALRPLAEQQRVNISLDLDRRDPEVIADEVQLEQVFTNLVSNAIKFTPPGGNISVANSYGEDTEGIPCVIVRISDTGVGVPEDEIAHLFTRFYRASNATSGAVPGSGLGLAIAHDIVDRHKGRMDVTSKLGEGTTIQVQLPLAGPKSEDP
jgi:two-component system phosphate regulon sensor histidine kinase PhoR